MQATMGLFAGGDTLFRRSYPLCALRAFAVKSVTFLVAVCGVHLKEATTLPQSRQEREGQLVLCQLLIYGFGPIVKALVTCLSRTPYGFGSVSRQP